MILMQHERRNISKMYLESLSFGLVFISDVKVSFYKVQFYFIILLFQICICIEQLTDERTNGAHKARVAFALPLSLTVRLLGLCQQFVTL